LSNRIKSNDIQIGKNYVLPIEQSNVTLQQAKVKQIIEETDAKTQEMIDNAENKSNIIIGTANNEAQRIIEDARNKAQKEYETIKNQAYQEGFSKGEQDGLEKFKKDADETLKSLETLASSNFDIKKNIIDSATLDIVELVSVIADKVCHAKFNDKVLYRITLDAIKQLNEKENITIIVNPKLVDNINSMVESFKNRISSLNSIKIIEDNSVSPDGVIVETLSTRLDSRVSAQIAEISEKMLTGANNELG
jgi:flagellar assembly protein FliH